MKFDVGGGSLPYVVCSLDNGEEMKAETGAMTWMDGTIEYKTKAGGFGKAIGRMFTGESVFLATYKALADGSKISFSSSFPGEIKALNISENESYIIQKGAYLASTSGVDTKVYFQKKLGAGFFGGEGFIMNQLIGNGTAFIEVDGSCMEYDLKPGEELIVSTGHVVMMSNTCQMDIQAVKGLKNMLFGGQGIFNTIVRGPGRVWIQTMTVADFARRILSITAAKGGGN